MVSYKGLLIHIYCHLKFLKLLFSCFTDKNVVSNTFLGMIKNCWNCSIMSEKRFLSHFFATQSFLNCWIIIVHTTREPGTNFQAWSKIVELAQHFGFIGGLLIQFSFKYGRKLLKLLNNWRKTFLKWFYCHRKFLKQPNSYYAHHKKHWDQFLGMVKNCWASSTFWSHLRASYSYFLPPEVS